MGTGSVLSPVVGGDVEGGVVGRDGVGAGGGGEVAVVGGGSGGVVGEEGSSQRGMSWSHTMGFPQ